MFLHCNWAIRSRTDVPLPVAKESIKFLVLYHFSFVIWRHSVQSHVVIHKKFHFSWSPHDNHDNNKCCDNYYNTNSNTSFLSCWPGVGETSKCHICQDMDRYIFESSISTFYLSVIFYNSTLVVQPCNHPSHLTVTIKRISTEVNFIKLLLGLSLWQLLYFVVCCN